MLGAPLIPAGFRYYFPRKRSFSLVRRVFGVFSRRDVRFRQDEAKAPLSDALLTGVSRFHAPKSAHEASPPRPQCLLGHPIWFHLGEKTINSRILARQRHCTKSPPLPRSGCGAFAGAGVVREGLDKRGVALVKVGGKASLPRRSSRLHPSLEYLIRTRTGDTDSSGNSRPERLGAAYLYSTSSAGLPPRPKNRRWQVDANSATRGPEDYPFNFCSILLRVSKNLPVATAGPMRRRPKVFQPNICHQEV